MTMLEHDLGNTSMCAPRKSLQGLPPRFCKPIFFKYSPAFLEDEAGSPPEGMDVDVDGALLEHQPPSDESALGPPSPPDAQATLRERPCAASARKCDQPGGCFVPLRIRHVAHVADSFRHRLRMADGLAT